MENDPVLLFEQWYTKRNMTHIVNILFLKYNSVLVI